MRNLLVLAFVLLFTSCNNTLEEKVKIDGLWLVTKVKMGENEMTPVAKWFRFNSDSTQTSGNGWLQHSFGKWSFNSNTNKLSTTNDNGVTDTAEPFTVRFENQNMIWSRTEEGENVQVFMKRTDKIPTSEGNKLMGLWKLDTIKFKTHQDDYKSFKKIIPFSKASLFLRWDNTYVKQISKQEKEYGIYKIHGHKAEIQMVNYGKNPKFTFYRFSITKERLTLENTEGNEELVYQRIHQFPQ